VKTELLLNLQLILGTGLLILLGVFTFVLINRIRQRRAQIINLKSSEPSFPFPQRLGAALEGEMLSQARAKREELISAAYAHWLESFFLPDAEPGRAFVRTGVAKTLAALPADYHQPRSGSRDANLCAAGRRGPPGADPI
jgi:hypothetical protein